MTLPSQTPNQMARLDKTIQILQSHFEEISIDSNLIMVKQKKNQTDDMSVRAIKESFPNFLVVDQYHEGRYFVIEYFV